MNQSFDPIFLQMFRRALNTGLNSGSLYEASICCFRCARLVNTAIEQPSNQSFEIQRTNRSQSINQSNHRMIHRTIIALLNTGSLYEALNYFDRNAVNARVETWHCLFKRLIELNQFDQIQSLFNRYQSIIPSRQSIERMTEFERNSLSLMLPNADIYALLLQCKHPPINVNEALINLSNCGLNSNQFLHNSIIKDFVKARDFEAASHWLKDMKQRGIQPDVFTFGLEVSIIKHRQQDSKVRSQADKVRSMTCSVWDRLIAYRIVPTHLLINFFAKSFRDWNDLARTAELMDLLMTGRIAQDARSRSLRSANINVQQIKAINALTDLRLIHNILAVLVRKDRIELVMKFYEYLRLHQRNFNLKVFELMIHAFHRQGDVNSINLLLDEMTRSGRQPNARILNTVIRTHARNGDTQSMHRTLAKMSSLNFEPDVHTLEAIQSGVCEWFWDVTCAQEKRNGNNSAAREKDYALEFYSPRELTPEMEESMLAIELQPLSVYLLPWINMMRGVSKSERIYRRILLALEADADVSRMLHFLHEMIAAGFSHSQRALHAVINELFLKRHSFELQDRLEASQLFLLLETLIARNVQLSESLWHSLLHIAIASEQPSDIQRCYAMIAAKVPPAELQLSNETIDSMR